MVHTFAFFATLICPKVSPCLFTVLPLRFKFCYCFAIGFLICSSHLWIFLSPLLLSCCGYLFSSVSYSIDFVVAAYWNFGECPVINLENFEQKKISTSTRLPALLKTWLLLLNPFAILTAIKDDTIAFTLTEKLWVPAEGSRRIIGRLPVPLATGVVTQNRSLHSSRSMLLFSSLPLLLHISLGPRLAHFRYQFCFIHISFFSCFLFRLPTGSIIKGKLKFPLGLPRLSLPFPGPYSPLSFFLFFLSAFLLSKISF